MQPYTADPLPLPLLPELLPLPLPLPLPFPEHVLQQYFPNCEQAPIAFTAAQDLILPADSLDTWLADESAQDADPDPEPLLALPLPLPLPLLQDCCTICASSRFCVAPHFACSLDLTSAVMHAQLGPLSPCKSVPWQAWPLVAIMLRILYATQLKSNSPLHFLSIGSHQHLLVLVDLHLFWACMRQYLAHVLPVWFHMQPSVRPFPCVSLPDLPHVLWLLLLQRVLPPALPLPLPLPDDCD